MELILIPIQLLLILNRYCYCDMSTYILQGQHGVNDTITGATISGIHSKIQCASICLSQNCISFGFDSDSETCYFDHISTVVPGVRGATFVRSSFCHELPSEVPSQVYQLYMIDESTLTDVFCDMKTVGGWWTVIQRRYNGDQIFFNKNWEEYKNGFGDPNAEYWLGNEFLYRLTSVQPYELYIEIESFYNELRYVRYPLFSISSEAEGYKIRIIGFSGNSTDSMHYQSGQPFTTTDKDNDMRPGNNCAHVFSGAWWYRSCHHSNLNGIYNPMSGTNNPHVMCWKNFVPGSNVFTPLRMSEMKIRPA